MSLAEKQIELAMLQRELRIEQQRRSEALQARELQRDIDKTRERLKFATGKRIDVLV